MEHNGYEDRDGYTNTLQPNQTIENQSSPYLSNPEETHHISLPSSSSTIPLLRTSPSNPITQNQQEPQTSHQPQLNTSTQILTSTQYRIPRNNENPQHPTPSNTASTPITPNQGNSHTGETTLFSSMLSLDESFNEEDHQAYHNNNNPETHTNNEIQVAPENPTITPERPHQLDPRNLDNQTSDTRDINDSQLANQTLSRILGTQVNITWSNIPEIVQNTEFIPYTRTLGINNIIPDFTNTILNTIKHSGTDQWTKLKQLQDKDLPPNFIPFIKDITRIISNTFEKRQNLLKKKESAYRWTESGIKPIVSSINTIKKKMEDLAISRITIIDQKIQEFHNFLKDQIKEVRTEKFDSFDTNHEIKEKTKHILQQITESVEHLFNKDQLLNRFLSHIEAHLILAWLSKESKRRRYNRHIHEQQNSQEPISQLPEIPIPQTSTQENNIEINSTTHHDNNSNNNRDNNPLLSTIQDIIRNEIQKTITNILPTHIKDHHNKINAQHRTPIKRKYPYYNTQETTYKTPHKNSIRETTRSYTNPQYQPIKQTGLLRTPRTDNKHHEQQPQRQQTSKKTITFEQHRNTTYRTKPNHQHQVHSSQQHTERMNHNQYHPNTRNITEVTRPIRRQVFRNFTMNRNAS
jgi:hypothetical protein